MALIKCKECDHEISKKAKTCPSCGSKNKHTSLAAQIIFVIVFGFFLKVVLIDSSATSHSPRASASAANALELVSWSCNQGHGFMIIRGEVKNISGTPLENVMAVADFRQADGTFVKSNDTLIEYNPILAGQTSPFKVMSTHNPAITKCNVSFKKLLGGTLNYTEAQ